MYLLDNKPYEKIGYGGEGHIYKIDDNNVMKIFVYQSQNSLINKFNKIEKLKQITLPGFIFPKQIVLENNIKSGYIMDYVRDSKTLSEILDNNSLSINEKIKYLKKVEELLKKAHKNGLSIVDIKGENFMVNTQNEIFAIDTDNYSYEEYNADVITRYPSHYQVRVSKTIDHNTDKYVFGIFALEVISGNPNLYKIMKMDRSDTSLINYVDSLDINKVLKKEFKNLFSPSLNKQYIGDSLDLINTKK